MYLKFLSFVFIVLSTSVFGQLKLDTLNWQAPVDIPIYLSGNFAELRTGHFHGGIDIKTQGQEGFKVYAVQEGYISRIKVAPGGYGKAIYISHPDGYTSVYGHLKEYNIQLDKYVRALQYDNESYEIDIFPQRGELPVNKGDVIGLSGNTGSSAGPHLHFEIRDTRNSHPMNGLFLGYDILDNIPPKMEYLYVYPQYEKSHVNNKSHKHYYSLRKTNGSFSLRQGDTLKVAGTLGLGLKVNDYLNGSANRCGVYELKGYMDEELFFHEKFDGFSFGETRYINSLMDYEENKKKRRKLHKMFIEPNNKLSVYVDDLNRGLLDFSEVNKTHKIYIEAMDAAGNKSSLKFYVQSESSESQPQSPQKECISIPWENKFKMDTMGLQLSFDKASFYDTLQMEFSVDTSANGLTYSPVYNIHNGLTPSHKYFEIAIKYAAVADSLKSKLLLGYWNKDAFAAAGGLEKEGFIHGMVRELGSYSVLIDTTKPTITPLGILAQNHELSGITKLQFIIDDNFSGISSYKGSINGTWVLFEYDSKNNLITYHLDKYMPKEGAFILKVEAVDERGNRSIFEKEYEIYSERDYDIGQ